MYTFKRSIINTFNYKIFNKKSMYFFYFLLKGGNHDEILFMETLEKIEKIHRFLVKDFIIKCIDNTSFKNIQKLFSAFYNNTDDYYDLLEKLKKI